MSKEAMKLALEDYLSREMPAGTVIGDPKWWAAKIANVMTGKAVAEVYKQGYDHGVERQEAIQKLSEIEKQTPASKNQWWAKELEGFWGDSDYRVTLDTRRAAKTALTIIFDTTPQPKQEQGEPVAWMEEGWGPDCGPYIEFYRDDEMGWRDRKEWTPLYTTPYVPTGRQPAPQRSEDTMQQKPWVGLTDEEVDFIADKHATLQGAIWAIEAKLKEKNT